MPRELPDLQGNPLASLRRQEVAGITACLLPEDAPILITFARPEESRVFCRRVADFQPNGRGEPVVGRGKVGTTPVAVAHTGIGPVAAELAIRKLFETHPWRLVIAAGFAGALDPALKLGDTVMEELPTQARRRIVSAEQPVETVAAKRDLFGRTGALAVDMETDTIARLCSARPIPLLVVRAISDAADSDLPVPFPVWFNLEKQRPRPIGLLLYLARNPGRIPAFYRFVRSIRRVSEALALAVEGSVMGMEHI